MQDKYVSLTPEFAANQQAFNDRLNLWESRYDEAAGGPLARGVGFITGLTAATWTYSARQNHGFTGFFPIARNNAAHYALIVGAGLVAYHFGSNLIAAVTGDVSQMNYLSKNKYNIVSGQAPYDREK